MVSRGESEMPADAGPVKRRAFPGNGLKPGIDAGGLHG